MVQVKWQFKVQFGGFLSFWLCFVLHHLLFV